MKILWNTIVPAVALTLLSAAYADVLDFELTPAALTVSVGGGTAHFAGLLSNLGPSDVFLNGDLITLPSSGTVDDFPFFEFSPLFLASGGSYMGPFFDVVVDPSTSPGNYSGSFTIQGGADSNAFENLATQNFSVDVVASVVPEPSTLISTGTGLLFLFLTPTGVIRRRSRLK